MEQYKKNKIEPLFKVGEKLIFFSDFVNGLQEAGLKNRDIIFVHSDLQVFGRICTFDRNFLLDALIDAIKEVVGPDGTIVMPTFTYSFCKGETFDIDNTKSSVGVLTEFFRNQKDVIRTIHPIFSVGIWGKHKEKLVNMSKDSFDKNSIFGKIHKLGGKIVFLGASFQSCTYIHYIEQMHRVPYRFMKTFKGKIKEGNNTYYDEYSYLVRYLNKNVVVDLSRLENYLLKKGYMTQTRIGNGNILVVDSDILLKEGYRLLDEDIYFFLKEKPNI